MGMKVWHHKTMHKKFKYGIPAILLNLLWLFFGGLWACLMHLFFGFLLCITIIGIPWGKQHFKMAGLSLAPFGKDLELGF